MRDGSSNRGTVQHSVRGADDGNRPHAARTDRRRSARARTGDRPGKPARRRHRRGHVSRRPAMSVDRTSHDDESLERGSVERPSAATAVAPTEADKARGPVNIAEAPEARLYTSAPREADDGTISVIQQQNVGPDNELGGG